MTIEEYLSSVIDSLNSEMTDEELLRISDEVSQRLCEYNYYYGDRESFTTTINGLFREYINNTLDKAELFNRINEEMTLFINSVQVEETPSDTGGGGGGGHGSGKSSKKEEETTNIGTDVLVEDIDSATAKYQQVESQVDGISITGDIAAKDVQPLITELKNILATTIKAVKAELKDVKKVLFDYTYKITGGDDDAPDLIIGEDGITSEKKKTAKVDNPTFADISTLTKKWKAKSPVAKADASFFRNAGYTVSDKGIVSMGKYEYNTETGQLINKKTNTKAYVDYFVPKTMIGDNEKLSKANTITCLAGAGDAKVSEKNGFGNISGYKSNSIIVIPSKQGLVDKSRSYTGALDAVADSTTFATKFSRQKTGCKNTIGGASSGGGSAVKAAAKYDIYDSAFSINYPPLIEDITGGKGYPEDRLTDEDIAGLKNKTLLFIESKSDVNYNLTEKGVRRLSKSVKNVYFTTNAKSANAGKARLLDWDSFAKNSANTTGGRANGEYTGHASCRGLMADVVNSGMFDNNEYTA